MSIQEACEITEEMLIKDAFGAQPKFTMKQFAALNQLLLELTSDGKYVIPDKYYEQSQEDDSNK